MTCNKCIHYDVCEALWQMNGIPKVGASQCGFFKDKSLFVELPCKLGDKVYAVVWSQAYQKMMVALYYVDELFYATKRGVRPCVVVCYGGARFDNCDFGKTVFLTKEEAEAKLKELEE